MKSLLFVLCVGRAVAYLPNSRTAVTPGPWNHQLRCRSSQLSSVRKVFQPPRWILEKKKHRRQYPLKSSTIRDDEGSSNRFLTSAKPVISACLLIALDVFFRQLFASLLISFPSSLAGCGALFGTFLLAPFGAKLYDVLSPGAALLAKWLPVFFVPSLVTLPLSDGVGSFLEILKVFSVIIGGFFFTLLTTAWTVVGIRKLLPSKKNSELEVPKELIVEPTSPSLKPFSDELNNTLRAVTVASGAAAVLAAKIGGTLGKCSTPLSSLFMLSSTITGYVFGARLPKKFTKIVHPLLTCAAITWSAAVALCVTTGKTFTSMLKAYRSNNLSPTTAGAGDILLFLLGPAVVSLACSMYDRRKLMRENIKEVGAAVGVSAFGGIFGTAAAVSALQVYSPYLRLSLLSRNITSPLAMAIASILGADVSLAVSVVVITGLFGANFGASILDAFGISDPVARGLGIGAAAHGLGTAAFVNEKDAFPFAAIAMALTASATTVIVSIPLFRRIILQMALV